MLRGNDGHKWLSGWWRGVLPPSFPTLSLLASRQAADTETGLVVVRFSVGPFLPEGRENSHELSTDCFPGTRLRLCSNLLFSELLREGDLLSLFYREGTEDPRQQMVRHSHVAGGHQKSLRLRVTTTPGGGPSRCREVGPFPAPCSLSRLAPPPWLGDSVSSSEDPSGPEVSWDQK